MKYLRLLLLYVLLALTVGVIAANPPGVSDGALLVQAGDFSGAVELLSALAPSHPYDAALHYWLGRAYFGQGHYSQAVEELNRAVAAAPDAREACRWDARALRAAGQLTKAADAYAALRRRFPDDNEVLDDYAVSRALAGDYREAREAFTLLASRDTGAETQAFVGHWLTILNALIALVPFEPPMRQQFAHFELRCDPDDSAVTSVTEKVERARQEVSDALGVPVIGFRVLLFSTWSSYSRYAHGLIPANYPLRATAFTLPGLLVLWSPADWPPRVVGKEAEVFGTLHHEMAHLAVGQRTNGQIIPLWLNEGLACYYGGWGGMQSGQLPATPFELRALDQALERGTLNSQEQAYAQAEAMVTVMAEKAKRTGILAFLDMLAAGVPLPVAYQMVYSESFDTFLASWPARYMARNAAKP